MNSELLRKLRCDRGETRRAVSLATGLTENTILNLESGIASNPRLATLIVLADHYGVTIDSLVTPDDE